MRKAHLTICHQSCSHSKQHDVDNAHRRVGTEDGGWSEDLVAVVLVQQAA